MKNLAPDICRQRLIMEGFYSIEVTPSILKDYMKTLSSNLEMTIVYGPIVKRLAEKINPAHQGLESVLIWAESGASVYTWELKKFFTVDIYSCQKFDVKTTVDFTKEFFGAKELVFKSV